MSRSLSDFVREKQHRDVEEARQIDITTGINYTAFILSFPLKDSSLLLTKGGSVLKSKDVQMLKADKEQILIGKIAISELNSSLS